MLVTAPFTPYRNPQYPLWVEDGVRCGTHGDFHLGIISWLCEHIEMGAAVKTFSVLNALLCPFQCDLLKETSSCPFPVWVRQVLKTLPVSLKGSDTEIDPMAVVFLFLLRLSNEQYPGRCGSPHESLLQIPHGHWLFSMKDFALFPFSLFIFLLLFLISLVS